jgi:hypothetical protein
MASIDDALEVLSLSRNWINYGIVSSDDVCAYAKEALENKTIIDHAGSYFLSRYVESNDNLTLSQINNYIHITLTELDPDEVHDCLSWLMESKSISCESLLSFRYEEFIEKYNLSKKYNRWRIIKCLEDQKVEDAVIFEAIDTSDAQVQYKVLELFGDRVDILKKLAKNGANKKIRNISKAKIGKFDLELQKNQKNR